MSTDQDFTQQDVVEKLRGTSIVMLTTARADGKLLSHPMTVQDVTDDADVWLFVGLQGDQADALRQGPEVNLNVSEAGSWLSVAGRATFVEDRTKIAELWDDSAKSYFPGGVDDPNLALVLVTSESAQYWGLPGGKVEGVAQILKAKVTGGEAPGGTGTTEL